MLWSERNRSGVEKGETNCSNFAVKWHDITSFLKKHSGHHLLNTEQMLSAWLMPSNMVGTRNKTLNTVPKDHLSSQLDFNGYTTF